MLYDELLKELDINDLPEQYRLLAAKIGLDTLIAVSKAVGGTQQYVPMTFELIKCLIYKKIMEEFEGDNIQSLAIKYGVSESTVRRTIQEQIIKKKREPYKGQLTLC